MALEPWTLAELNEAIAESELRLERLRARFIVEQAVLDAAALRLAFAAYNTRVAWIQSHLVHLYKLKVARLKVAADVK